MVSSRMSTSGRPLPIPSRKRAIRRLAGAALALPLALSLALGGCETVQFGPGDGTDNPPPDTLSSRASLTFMNQRETDPGPLTFLLYRSTAMDIEAVAPLHEFGPVEENGYLGVKVAAGRYKLAYQTETGDLQAMPDSEEEGTGADWPVINLSAGKSYQLLIATSDGGVTTWVHNLPTGSP